MLKKKMIIKGIAHWPKLVKPDEYKGNIIGWTIQVEPDKGEYDRVMKELTEFLEESKGDKEFEGKVWADHPCLGLVEDKNGRVCYKFKKVHEFRDKSTGELIQTKVPIYDKYGCLKDFDIGDGSEVTVAFHASPFHMTKNNNGLTLRLDAVQVLNLKSRAMGAEFFGFEVEDGGEDQPDTENPFL